MKRLGSLVSLGLLACALGCADEPMPGSMDMAASTELDMSAGGDLAGPDLAGADLAGSDLSMPTVVTCPTTRALADLDDEVVGSQIKLMYVLPSDGVDEQLDTNGRLCTSVNAWSVWLKAQTAGSMFRLDTHGGALDITFVRLGKTNAQLRGSNDADDVATGYAYLRDRIELELAALGFTKPGRIYAVYYGGSSPYACGGAAHPPALIGKVAAFYLKAQVGSGPVCDSGPWGQDTTKPGYPDYAMLHEIVHTIGIVGDAAPHAHASGHVFDGATPARDLMYSPRAGQSDPGWDVYNPGGLLLDVGHDDYYGHGNAAFVDLARSAFLAPLPANAQDPPGW